MANIASVYLEGTISDTEGFVTNIDSLTTTSTAAVISHTRVTLASGANTILIPAGARGVIISFLPPGSGSLKTLKGVAGDIGIPLATGVDNHTFMLLFGATPGASFVINSAALGVTFSEFFFF